MNNNILVRILDRDHLLCLVELLSRALMMPEASIQELVEEVLFYDLPPEVLYHCDSLSDYQRLELMQLAVEILVSQTEKPTVEHFQTTLPLKLSD